MERSVRLIINGLAALALSLLLWRLTGSFLGWLVLFMPGSTLVLWGGALMLRGE